MRIGIKIVTLAVAVLIFVLASNVVSMMFTRSEAETDPVIMSVFE